MSELLVIVLCALLSLPFGVAPLLAIILIAIDAMREG